MTQKQETKAQTPAKVQPTASERFTSMVTKEFSSKTGAPALTTFQKRLIQNYFINLDINLKKAEEKRLKKSEQYRDKVPITWENVNMVNLALDVVACARIGFDPALANHINMIPYKDNNTGKYNIGFIEGYRGIEIKAMKYGFRTPSEVIVEVVYQNDTFKAIKKDKDNRVENYIFQINNPFDRGEIIGGFYYHLFEEEPYRNKLRVLNLQDIKKRIPEYASPEFWGGEKPKYVNGKRSGTEQVEGWFPEMVYKTIYRAAYNDITIDSEKIDENFMRLAESEQTHALNTGSEGVNKEIRENANRDTLDITDATLEETEKEQAPGGQEADDNSPEQTEAEETLSQTSNGPTLSF